MRPFLLTLLLLVFAAPALAADGVLEINQTCAVETGCFAGDDPGWPVTISTPGSYRLTSNLALPDENTGGILVSASDVGIDLNNFAILGPVTCSTSLGPPVTCTPASGSGSGVERQSSVMGGISLKNGSISGMGRYGVRLGLQAEVMNLRVRWNGFDGINVGTSSIVSGNTAYENGGIGIFANVGSTISGNAAFHNGGVGINGSHGTNISSNTAFGNGGNGIVAGQASMIIGNTAYDNGDASSPALDDGIECADGCNVRGNMVRSNSGYGLNLGALSAYSDNVVTGNTTGTVTGAGSPNIRGGNYCTGTGPGSTDCP